MSADLEKRITDLERQLKAIGQNYVQLKRTRTEGHQPGIDQINTNTMVYNEADGLWYSKKRLPDGTESIVLIGGGSPPGTSDPHLRAHQIDSADDHPAVPEVKRGKLVATNPTTGAIELLSKEEVGGVNDVFAYDHPYFPALQDLYKTTPDGDELITTMQKPQGLVWGGVVTWIEVMDFVVSVAIYYIIGEPHSAPDSIITIADAHETLNRIDIVVANDDNTFSVITGEPGVNPAKPAFNPLTQIEVTQINVPAGTTNFGGIIGQEIIYNENLEWTGVGSGVTVDFDSETSPYLGTICADVGAIGNLDTIIFTGAAAEAVDDYKVLSLFLKLKATQAKNESLSVQFLLAGVAVSNESTLLYDKRKINDWQNVIVDITTLSWSNTQFDALKFIYRRRNGEHTGFYLDYIKVESGIEFPVINTSIILQGDVTGLGVTGVPLYTKLKTVNANPGIFGSATKSAVVTVNAKGLVTEVTEADITGGGGGDSAYVYIAYASDASGTGFTLTFDANLDYIAILSTDTEILTPVVGDFAGLWKNYKGAAGANGADGADGSNGIDGDDGANAYLYIAYASDDIGTDFSLSPGASLTYIAALSTDTEIVTPQASDFVGLWRKYVGEDGTANLTHYCYIAWRDAPGDGFTLTPNLSAAYEAILITHTELTAPVEADFDGYWRERLTIRVIHEVPAGGTTGQVIKKQSNDDFDIDWEDDNGGGSGGSTELVAIPPIDKTASGITTHFTANENQAFGDIVRINSTGKAQLAKADVIANATALAMCIADVLADATGEYLLLGFVRNDAWNWTIGEWIYLSLTGTSGNTLTQTSPFAADPIVEDTVVQMLGVANTADTIYFNPQLVQVELKP